jgi:hypothetical protein
MHIIVLETHNIDELINRMKRQALIERRADDLEGTVLETRMKVSQKLLEHYPSNLISRFKADQRSLEILGGPPGGPPGRPG